MRAPHKCPGAHCGRQVRYEQLACPRHWYWLPRALRNTINQAYISGDWHEHGDALQDALRWYEDHPDGPERAAPEGPVMSPTEDRASYYIDGLGRVWAFSEPMSRWFSPDINGARCNWEGVQAYAFDRHGRGELRKATPEERAEIDREMFS